MTTFATAAKSAVLFALAAACAAKAAAGARCDGPLSLERVAERAGARFAALDADADGMVSRGEFDAAALARRGAMKGHHHARWARWLDDLDAKQRAAARRERERALFAALDVDRSGQLSAREFARRRDVGRALFRDRVFERMDADASGALSAIEFTARLSRLAERDADRDGQLSCAERRRAR